MKLGLVTYNVARGWDIETIIQQLEAAKWEAVELRTTHAHGVEPSLSTAEREKVRDRFMRSKVRLLSLGTTCEYHSPDPAVVRERIAETERFVDLAHDLGCWGIKVRPNGLPEGVPEQVTLQQIGKALRECGDIGERKGVEIWVEVHGRETQDPVRIRTIMDACSHPNVGVCWNSNPGEAVNGSIKKAFELLRPFIKNVHINDLASDYPYRELFGLLRASGYDRYCLAEVAESKEPERFLRYYRALWLELNRA
ncbi:MAG: sugar phosphate isomerase/epimerase [Acidobacteria bacterium]|nr:sugar phosphate isomerase/epimerase [Acidobacteriota bacterium]